MLTVQASCVHTAVSAVKVLCAVRATRKDRPDAAINAALPTVASGELASMVSEMVLLTMFELIVASAGRVPPPLADVGLLPPHPVSAVATAASEAV